MSDRIRTTEEIRKGYVPDLMIVSERPYEAWRNIAYDEFDQWLAVHDAEIRADEREQAAQLLADAGYQHSAAFLRNLAAVRGEDASHDA